MDKKILGVIILIVTIIAVVAYKFIGDTKESKKLQNMVTVKGLIGSEKQGFFENQKIKDILKNKYNIVVDYAKAGSIEMIKNRPSGYDFFFPSSQVAGELYKILHDPHAKVETIFNSPIVMYSWDIVTEALLKKGIVQKRDNSYYVADFDKMINLVLDGKKWADINLDQLYGKIMVYPTNPNKSNSGFQFSGLLANMINGGEVVDSENLIGKNIGEVLVGFFKRIGYMERSTGYLFEQFLTTGVGSKPIVIGYENQIIEFCKSNLQTCDKITKRVNILYPEPTVWSSHVIIPLNKKANLLIHALADKDIQQIAWQDHGFRSANLGVSLGTSDLPFKGISKEVKKVMPMPNAKTMEQILEILQKNNI